MFNRQTEPRGRKTPRARRGLCRVAVTAALLLPALSVWGGRPAHADGTPGNLLGPFSDERTWEFLTIGDAKGSMTREATDVLINVTTPGANGYNVQLQAFPVLQEGQTYTLHFRAKADPPRSLYVSGALNQPDYHQIGLNELVPLTGDWKDFTETFTAHNLVPGHNCAPQFQVGNKVGRVWLADVSLVPAAADSLFTLQPGEVRLEGTVRNVAPARGRLTLLATQAQDPGSTPQSLDPPRPKVITVTPATTLRPAGSGPATLSAFQPGDTVIVIGKSLGNGKPLDARLISGQ